MKIKRVCFGVGFVLLSLVFAQTHTFSQIRASSDSIREQLDDRVLYSLESTGLIIGELGEDHELRGLHCASSVIIKSSLTLRELESELPGFGIDLIWGDFFRVSLGSRSLQGFDSSFQAISSSVALRDLGRLYKNPIGFLENINDPLFDEQWGLNNTGQSGERYFGSFPEPPYWMNSWDVLPTENGVVGFDLNFLNALPLHDDASSIIVAVLDTGIALNHPDLVGNLWINTDEIPNTGLDDDNNGYIDDYYGWRHLTTDGVVDSGGDVADDHGSSHGTAVSSIIVANRNSIGMAGIAPTAKIMTVKIAKSNGSVSGVDAVAGVGYAIDNGAHIINASWSFVFNDEEFFQDMIAPARDAGILFVASPGNLKDDIDVVDASGNNTFPGAASLRDYPNTGDWNNIITVSAMDRTGTLAYNRAFPQSNSGSGFGRQRVHLAAPGAAIITAEKSGGNQLVQGTSFAIPHVSAALAQLMKRFPDALPEEIRFRLISSATYSDGLDQTNMMSGQLDLLRAYSVFSDYPSFEGTTVRSVPWFGSVNSVDDGDYPWCSHINLGDFFVESYVVDESDMWIFFPWMNSGEWIWTNSSNYPWMYRLSDDTWISFDMYSGVPPSFVKSFYNSSTGNWEHH